MLGSGEQKGPKSAPLPFGVRTRHSRGHKKVAAVQRIKSELRHSVVEVEASGFPLSDKDREGGSEEGHRAHQK